MSCDDIERHVAWAQDRLFELLARGEVSPSKHAQATRAVAAWADSAHADAAATERAARDAAELWGE